MQDRPSAQDLLQTVAAFLEHEVIPVVADPRLRFRLLIASNVLAIVQRELAAGEAPLRVEWRRLAALLGESADREPLNSVELEQEIRQLEQALCARVRAGEMDRPPEFDAALDYAEATVADKLRVTNPRLLERVGRR